MSKKHQLKYIVISDLHLGEKNSLLTNISKGENKLLYAFSDCLADLLFHFNGEDNYPTMVFNGDILGLAFSTYQKSLTCFEEFVSALTIKNKICDKVAYIPGNHDHHIWQQAMEDKYRQQLSEREDGADIPELNASTGPLFNDGFESSFFKAFMQKKDAAPISLKILYPNFIIPSTGNNAPYVLFHHGHFSENTYQFVTKAMQAMYPGLPSPETTNNLEVQNGAWIDFAFSQLGRSGEAGDYFEELMNTLSNKEKLEEHKDELANNIAKSIDFPYLPFHWMEKYLSKKLLTNIADSVRSERYKGDTTCSSDTMNNLLKYFDTFCHKTLKENGWKNEPIHFVWSHTHKPFEKKTNTEHFGETKLTNTGGWVITPKESPMHGASIVLINQDNEVEALQIFKDFENKEKGIFKVEAFEGESLSDFGKAINNSLNEKGKNLKPVWQNFKDQLGEEIAKRRTN